MIKERPILFSTPMVEAIMNDRKTVTRRIVKAQDVMNHPEVDVDDFISVCRYGKKGDILWIRETFARKIHGNRSSEFAYKAGMNPEQQRYVWKPSIHMPKEACRFILRITKVNVEKVQDITEEEAIKEGVFFDEGSGYFYVGDDIMAGSAKEAFRQLWIKINGEESWNSNPWLWVIDFEVGKLQ